jgi:aryl-alcohol dehydrogenase-like predicted oxidoreductase
MIGLGTAAIGRPLYINIKSSILTGDFDKVEFSKKGKQILTAAYNNGVRHFDTAPGYGMAEQILLEWIAEFQPKELNISTKWGYTYVADFDPTATVHEVKEHSLSKLNEQWEVSKKFLPYLNIYQIHSATLDSGVLTNEAVLARLYELKKEYKINIGLSTSGDNQNEIIERALEIKVNNEPLFDSFQVTYNVFDQNLLKLSDTLQAHGKKLIIKEALANGRVFPNEQFPNYKNNYNLLESLALKYKVGVDAIALRFCEDTLNPYSVLSGASITAQLVSNLEASNFQLSNDEIEQIKALAVSPKVYWEERKALGWN